MADLRPKGLRLFRANFGWASSNTDIFVAFEFALDLAVQFKLLSGIRTCTQIWVHIELGSSGPHCTKGADNQQRPAALELRLGSDFPRPSSSLTLSGHAPWRTRSRKVPGFGLATFRSASCSIDIFVTFVDFTVQFKLLFGIRVWTMFGSSNPM